MDKKHFSIEHFADMIRQEAEDYGFMNEDETIVSIDEATVPEFVAHIKESIDLFLKEELLESESQSEDPFDSDDFLLMDDADDSDDDTIY